MFKIFFIFLSFQIIESSLSKCGHHDKIIRVFGGEDAAINEYPWVAYVKYGRTLCGGSLINRRYVLTAAHCFRENGLRGVVRLGEHDLRTDPDCRFSLLHRKKTCAPKYQKFKMEKISIHENFDNVTKHNDIALIRLDRNVEFSENIQAICLPNASADSIPGELLEIVGWGKVNNTNAKSFIKQKLKIPIVDFEKCRRKFKRIISSQICAGGHAGQDSCSGDSGGPLQKQSIDGQWFVEGIISFGKECGKERWPAIYTKVSAHLDWIHTKMDIENN